MVVLLKVDCEEARFRALSLVLRWNPGLYHRL